MKRETLLTAVAQQEMAINFRAVTDQTQEGMVWLGGAWPTLGSKEINH